ncbi:MAG: hypothetical protein ACLSHG_05875 [Oscillospiraceae bacterium]
MKQNKLRTLYEKDATKKILASLLSILIGLVVGSVIIAAVGFSNPELGASSVWDGIRIVFAGLFSTGRTASGVLTWGFNSTNFGNMLFRATPLIMTGLSVAVAFKTGLFNIGAPGQYLMGTLVSLLHRARHPIEQRRPVADLDPCVSRRRRRRCALGRDPRRAQGVFEHQRGAGEAS